MDRTLTGTMWAHAGSVWQLLLPRRETADHAVVPAPPERPPMSRTGNFDLTTNEWPLAIAVKDDRLRRSLRIALRGVAEVRVQGWYASGRELLAAADSREAPRWRAVVFSDCVDDMPWNLALKALSRRMPDLRAVLLRSETHSPQRLVELALGVDICLNGEASPVEWAAKLLDWRRQRHGFSRALAQQLLTVAGKPAADGGALQAVVQGHRGLLEMLAEADSTADVARRLHLGEEPFWCAVERLRDALAEPACRQQLMDTRAGST